MTWEKDALAGKKGLIYSAIILASLYMISLLLAYNTYKEGIKGFDHLVSHIIPPYINTPELIPKETKKAIQAAFPWAVLVFITLYTSLVTLWRKRRDNFLSFSHYALLFLLQALIINIFFFSSNRHTLIVLNLSLPYFVILLTISDISVRIVKMPVVLRIKTFFMESPLSPYIFATSVIFMLYIYLILSTGPGPLSP